MSKKSADKIVSRLSGNDPVFRDRAVSILLEFALEQPVSAYLHVDDLVSLITLVCTGPNATNLIERHMRHGWDRNIARCHETQDTIGAGLPEDVQARIPR